MPEVPTMVDVPRIRVARMDLKLVGDSPLVVHKWSEKAKGQMAAKQQKKGERAKAAKDPQQEFRDSLHSMGNGAYGFPASGFKRAAVSACRYADGMAMTVARGAFHVNGDLVEIHGSEPKMREDMVRIARGTADIRYRGEFTKWWVTLDVSYNADVISPEQIVNLFNLAGFGVGVGEGRPERQGALGWGRFHVATEKER